METTTDLGPIDVRRVVARPSAACPGVVYLIREGRPPTPFGSAEALVASVRETDGRRARRGASTVTLIEWRDMPEGFVPPEGVAP